MQYQSFIEENYGYIDINIIDLVSSEFSKNEINYKFLANSLFGFSSKLAIKNTTNIFETKSFDYILAKLVFILSNKLKLNKDIIFNDLKNRKISLDKHKEISKSITQASIKTLLKYYPEKRVINLLLNNDLSMFKDTIYMFNQIEQLRDDFSFLPKKPKNIKIIHDALSRMTRKLETPDFNLEQRDDVLALDKKILKDGLTIRVPKCHYDLVDLGEALNFCIGNGYYSNQVKDKKCSIVGVFDNKGAKYGIQFTRYSIQQAYGFGNTKLPANILAELQNELTSKPEVPTDFISIADSTFIHGYKYNDKDLYLMLKEHIYIYYDVPKDVYEELINSEKKGKYLNQIIKGTYHYDKLS
jgi:hypothetical protein